MQFLLFDLYYFQLLFTVSSQQHDFFYFLLFLLSDFSIVLSFHGFHETNLLSCVPMMLPRIFVLQHYFLASSCAFWSLHSSFFSDCALQALRSPAFLSRVWLCFLEPLKEGMSNQIPSCVLVVLC